MGVSVSVGGEVPPLYGQLAQLADNAGVAHHHHGPGKQKM